MAAKYQIRTVVDKSIKDRIAQLMRITGHSESKQTKLLIQIALDGLTNKAFDNIINDVNSKLSSSVYEKI